MGSSIPKAGLLNSKTVGSNVAVGSGTAVGEEVAVGGNVVSVGAMGVAVGGNDVSVGGTGVAVGGSGVADGSDATSDGIGFIVGCTLVDVQPATPRVMSTTSKPSAKSLLISPSHFVYSYALRRS